MADFDKDLLRKHDDVGKVFSFSDVAPFVSMLVDDQLNLGGTLKDWLLKENRWLVSYTTFPISMGTQMGLYEGVEITPIIYQPHDRIIVFFDKKGNQSYHIDLNVSKTINLNYLLALYQGDKLSSKKFEDFLSIDSLEKQRFKGVLVEGDDVKSCQQQNKYSMFFSKLQSHPVIMEGMAKDTEIRLRHQAPQALASPKIKL